MSLWKSNFQLLKVDSNITRVTRTLWEKDIFRENLMKKEDFTKISKETDNLTQVVNDWTS